jgi:hypothetical protein
MPNATLNRTSRIFPNASGDGRSKSAPILLFLESENIETMLLSPYLRARLNHSPPDHVSYSKQALRQDLLRVRNAWEACQASRKRDAIYTYLNAVFDLVAWWSAENRALDRAHWALRLRRICPFDDEEPFAAVIRCTADPTKVDKRTRSKWSRALRYALEYKAHSEPLDRFIKRKGGINSCASRFTRSLGSSGGWRRARNNSLHSRRSRPRRT